MNNVVITGVDVYRWYVLPAMGELIGTALFVFFVNFASAPSSIRIITYPLISGISLFVLRGFFKKIAPGHYNPVVSVSQCVMRRIDGPTTMAFLAVQAFGAFLGAVLFRSLVSDSMFEQYFIGSYSSNEESKNIARSQGFFLDIILSAVICFSYMSEDSRDYNLQVPLCWMLVSFFSYPLIGQAGNVALSSANAVVYHIFTGDGTSTRHLYLHFAAGLIAIVLSSFIMWLLKTPTKRKRVDDGAKVEQQDKSIEIY
ncbi:unnamed protein product [Cylicocyclus nassatus]|uniref:Aquaporin n=1 Tax=Cylicocyclus nassatus TaxID=53992 RepID=A0AA36HB86_CYLNA|nr:unnamed protein product [Cylicocyclus nassatus]